MHSSGKFFSEEFLCLSKKLQIQLYFVSFLNIILISKNFEKNLKKSLHFPRGCANINESPGQRVLSRQPGVAKFGIALEWGSRGPEFESRHSDQSAIHWDSMDCGFFFFISLSFVRKRPRHVAGPFPFMIRSFPI